MEVLEVDSNNIDALDQLRIFLDSIDTIFEKSFQRFISVRD